MQAMESSVILPRWGRRDRYVQRRTDGDCGVRTVSAGMAAQCGSVYLVIGDKF